MAALDLNGDGSGDDAAALAALGIDVAERQRLASLYSVGETLWRVPIAHFTPWDCNWPYAPPIGALPPTLTPPGQDDSSISITPPATGPSVDDPITKCGSIIECENRGLGDTVAVAGTPWALHYRSHRTEGRSAAYTIDLNLTGKQLPPAIKGVELEITIGGTRLKESFAPSSSLRYTYKWEPKNAYGQSLEGSTLATIRVGYTYPLVYSRPAEFAQAFAQVAEIPTTLAPGRTEITLWQTIDLAGFRETLPTPWTNKPTALGGWAFSPHHAYDPRFQIVYLGTGEQRSAQPVVSPFAGQYQTYGFAGDGGPATKATLNEPEGVAVGPDGSVYIADAINAIVRKVSPSGTIATVAGTPRIRLPFGGPIVGDGGPATSALLQYPWDLEVGPDGTLYIVDFATIRKVSPGGVITTIAGTNEWSNLGEGDGGPATQAKVSPLGMALASDGTLYFMDGYGIRKVVKGIITTAYRGKTSAAYKHIGFDLASGPDGSIYFAAQRGSSRDIVRLYPSGVLSTFVTRVETPFGMSMGRDGSIYYSRRNGRYVYRAGPDGTHTQFAGTAEYEDRGDFGPPTAAVLGSRYLGRVALGPAGELYIADGANSVIRKIEPSLPGGAFPDGQRVVSADGAEVYLFDRVGRHLATVGRDGEPRLTFSYDTEGRFASVTDADGNETTIHRDGDGNPTAIVAPGGQQTRLSLDANGNLASVANPAGETSVYTYSADGLLLSYFDPRTFEHTFKYDDGGSLVNDTAPDGASTTLAQHQTRQQVTTTVTSAEGRQETMSMFRGADKSQIRQTVAPSGDRTQAVTVTDGTTTVTAPDGTVLKVRQEPDPRYGMHAPVVAEQTLRTPSGLVWDMTADHSADLEDPTRPFTLRKETSMWTINGREHVSTYDAAARHATFKTPAGRTFTTSFDQAGRPTRIGLPGASDIVLSYQNGLLSSMSAGDRTTSFTYNARNELTVAEDALGRRIEFTYDDAGRVLSQVLSGNRTVRFAYDRAGNVTSVTPPGRTPHGFSYTAGNATASYTAPANAVTEYLYNRDRQLTTIKRPDGKNLSMTYDGGGRLAVVSAPSGSYTFAYVAGDRVASVAHGLQQNTFTYDGPLLTTSTSSGTVAGAVSWRWNDDFLIVEETIAGSTSITFDYDPDGLLIRAGTLTLLRDPGTGIMTGSALGNVNDEWTYNSVAEPMSYIATYAETPLLSLSYSRDAGGRIAAMLGRGFEYDAAGRLIRVTEGGTPVAEYDYDANGNRTAHRYVGGSSTATYDEQDRLLTYDGTTYDYTAGGDLASKTIGGATTTFDYDVVGNLRKVVFPGDRTIEYVIDGYNRRVGKKVDGALVQGWLYSDQLHVVAELDANNAVISRFIYGSRSNVPDYMVKGGVTYRILSDHLGSPRLVIHANDGSVAQSVTYDEFGRVTADSNPGFQPFGFAGGLYDRDTNLVRFGARDYDAHTGRWTTKDRIGFAGGDTNLYAYVLNDPINLIDPMGTDWIETTASISAGVGDALLLGFGDELRDWTDETFGWSGGASVDECSTAYKGAYWSTTIATSVAGGGRLAYAGTAKGLSWAARAAGTEAAALRAASARDAVKVGFRLGMGGGYRIVDPAARLAKYGSADALARAVGRTSPFFNKAGAGAALSGAGAAAGGAGCGCP